MSAESTLTNKHHCREAVEHTRALAELALAEERCCRKLAECAATLAESELVAEQHCHKSDECATASGDYAKSGKYADDDYAEVGEYTEDGYDDGDYAKAGKYAEDEYDNNNVDESLTNIVKYNEDKDDVVWWIEAYTAPFFACIDAVMAKIGAMDDGFGDQAALAMSSLPRRMTKPQLQ